jgi:nucleoside-diphosphate-sugar epimerase
MRISKQALIEKRKRRTATILVTGATGFLGSHLAHCLLASGYHLIVLARSKNGKSARERVAQVFGWFDPASPVSTHYTVVEGAIEAPCFGLPGARYQFLRETVDEVVHCAANTAFAERKRAEVEKGNVGTTTNLLAFLTDSHAYFLHHISTAYVAGKTADGVCREEIEQPAEFNNVYEETKHKSEVLARGFCKDNGIRLSLYRPTIVYGDSETGRSTRFNALYFPVKTVAFLRDLFTKDISENGGRKAAPLGITPASGGRIHMPIRLEKNLKGRLNLIPIDFFVRAFYALFEEALDGGIFTLACDEPVTLDTLVEFVNEKFGIKGIVTTNGNGPVLSKNPLEVMFSAYLEAYRPYMLDTRHFSGNNARPILESKNIVCPPFTYDIFSRCMDYAVSVDWGKRVFEG